MLERKKQLVEADNQPTATGIIRIYEHRKSGDVFIVKDPNIPLSEVESVQDEISIMLETGGRIPEPIITTDPEPASESDDDIDTAREKEDEPPTSDENNRDTQNNLVNSSSEEE